jgi:hypothetical protein
MGAFAPNKSLRDYTGQAFREPKASERFLHALDTLFYARKIEVDEAK